MVVYLLSLEQKKELEGLEYIEGVYFNPIQDINGNWIISEEEVKQSEIEWVKELKQIKYEPIIIDEKESIIIDKK